MIFTTTPQILCVYSLKGFVISHLMLLEDELAPMNCLDDIAKDNSVFMSTLLVSKISTKIRNFIHDNTISLIKITPKFPGSTYSVLNYATVHYKAAS